MAKIAFFEIENWEKDYIKKAFKNYELFFSNEMLTKKNVGKVKDYNIIAVFIYSKVDKNILDVLSKLKLVTTMSTGFDHIDLKECKKRKITVCNVPTYGANTVAEHTFALILSISRKLPDSIDKTRRGDFRLTGLRGFDLKGKTIGIIGCGNIGQHVARIAKGFEMNILVFDINKDVKLAKKIGFRYSPIDNLLKKSDIITLHCPENKYTHHMLDDKKFKLVKKGAVLINTARGGIIDTGALLKALNNGTIKYAGLDVLEGECFVKEEKALLHPEFLKGCDLKTVLQDHILLQKPNVYITPHNAFNSREALLRILDTTIENIHRFLKKKPVNTVK
jgi:D-lactate dehydrogenase